MTRDNQSSSEDDIQPVLPRGFESGVSDDSENPIQGSSDERLTVTVLNNSCKTCGSRLTQKYHNGCDAPVIQLNGSWKCGSCGVDIPPKEQCPNCRSVTENIEKEVPLDLSPEVLTEKIEKLTHKQTNIRRKNNGLSQLQYSEHLSVIALRHSRDMAQKGYFSHESPSGREPSDRYHEFGHDTRSSGENIAKEYTHLTQKPTEAAKKVVESWMNSPEHRENILREQFGKEGIGVFLKSNGAMFITQNFY